jgi:hypothetical protein
LRASVSPAVATQPQFTALFIAADSRHDCAQVVGQNFIVVKKRFCSCVQQELLQPWPRSRQSPVQYLHSAGSALHCWAFKCDLNWCSFLPSRRGAGERVSAFRQPRPRFSRSQGSR